MTSDLIEKYNSQCMFDFARIIQGMAEKLKQLEDENERLSKINGGQKKKYIVEDGNGNVKEFRRLSQVAEFLDIYNWEVDDMIKDGSDYNGYTVDYVES